MKLIVDLPTDLVAQLLGKWLNFRHICKLEEAMCSAENRLRLRPIYETLVLNCNYSLDYIKNKEEQVDWFVLRGVKVGFLSIDYPLSGPALPKVLALIKLSNTHLRYVYLNGIGTSLSSVSVSLSRYCSGIDSLEVEKVALCAPFFAMLGNLCSLTELTFSECEILNNEDANSALCPSIRNLTLQGKYSIKMQKNILKMCPNLVTYSLMTDAVELQDMPSTLESLTVTECTSVQIINLNTNLKSLTIVCDDMEDADLAGMFTSCLHLDDLDLSFNALLTNKTLKMVADTYGQTLTALNIKSWDNVRSPAVKYLCEKCTRLTYLALGGYSDSFDPNCIIVALDNCPSLQILDIECSTINDEVLIRVAAAPLKAFHMSDTTGFTAKGVMALIDGCATLKKISVDGELITPLVQYTWKKLRPDLRFGWF